MVTVVPQVWECDDNEANITLLNHESRGTRTQNNLSTIHSNKPVDLLWMNDWAQFHEMKKDQKESSQEI